MAIEKGNIVVIEYEGKLDSGEVFDSSKGREPLKFEVGSGKVIKGFDDAVLGMERGQEKEFSIEPENAYGQKREELKKEIPKKTLQLDQEPKEGMRLMVSTPDGQQIPTKILKVTPETIAIDLNHPLAGQKLNFKIKVLEVE